MDDLLCLSVALLPEHLLLDPKEFLHILKPSHEPLSLLFQKLIVYLDVLLMVPVWEEPLRR